ncbi:helix-turn-helix domain-containing protein [Rhizobium sp. GCM10022189]|uniref:helix-turn-helix domain-containing protein n=1 Tax=Rhizobium sp. GCM10022189 TaxID=3252654 RepID=UPI003621D9ED
MIPAIVLKRVREGANIKQSILAERLGVSASVVSKLEKSEHADETMARRYLEAVDTDDARAVLAYYALPWTITSRPSFQHPDRDALWEAEQALQKLEEFEQSEEYDTLLSVPLDQIRSNLETSAEFVGEIDHSLAFVGAVGVGKTTALSLLTDLTIASKTGQLQPVFPATGGRTTTSEVQIRKAPAYGIAVEPMSSDEVRLLLVEMVQAIAEGKGGVSSELDRAIRNMSDLKKSRDPKDVKALLDPIKDMLEAAQGNQDDVTEEIFNRMKLSERTETQLIMSETNEDGLRWLSENITKINFGQHSRFSLPQRVVVFVPPGVVRPSKYDLSIIDTKGIHVTTERADLQQLYNDPRTLTVLCSAFNDAPGSDPLKLMKSMVELGSDAIERQRVMILVLPRGDEALKVVDDSGEPAESVEQGYALRLAQVENSLAEAGVGHVPTVFFNAMDGSAQHAWQEIEDRVGALRAHQVERLQRFVALSHDLVTNADAARIQQARVAIEAEVQSAVKSYRQLPKSVRPSHQTLIEQIKSGHPSSIAAAITRRGSWLHFEIHHFVGAGVRADANRRSSDYVTKITGRLESLQEKFRPIPEITGLLETLVEDLRDWRQEFLQRAQTIGRNTFKPYLDASAEFWSNLESRYGGGRGYREDIADMVQAWFEETPKLSEARDKVDARLADAWAELVLSRLLEATRVANE